MEDNPSAVELAQHAFAINDYTGRIDVCRDGEQALDFLLCRNGKSDRDPNDHASLILLDLKMPKVDGFEVLEQVRANPRYRSTPVVVLTASSNYLDINRAYKLGANSYLVKPVDFDQFVKLIGQVTDYWCKLNQAPPIDDPA